ncbi:GntR family transcriptional regulator [Falsihalocynthiibacter sp. BN13B15]|uniref:GntR family transcriptional regulator n=1 Tax=Falsihalocynthiibacter sp. BN13B15 TaxID=3240871 RepID=UPI00350FBECF
MAKPIVSSSPAQRRRRAPNSAPEGRMGLLKRSTSTISDSIYNRLHAQIISLELPPGTPISENATALTEGVSRTPVREAILRLSDEKLVEVVPKSGTFVARIPVSALPEALIARRALEAVTVRSATRLATRSQILSLRACVERHREITDRANISALHLVDEEFHATIASIGRLPGLWKLIQQVKVQIDRYRCLTLKLPKERRAEMVENEHMAIIEAMERGDGDGAVAAMEAHLTGLQLHFAVGINLYPDYFIHDIDLNEFADI